MRKIQTNYDFDDEDDEDDDVEKFWETDWFCLLMLFTIVPVGIFLTIINKKYKNKKFMIIAGSIFTVIVIIMGIRSAVTSSNAEKETAISNMKVYSKLEVKEVKPSNGEVIISGTTDLPNNSKVEIEFNVSGETAPATEIDKYIGVTTEATVKGGAFSGSVIPPDITQYLKGTYVVKVNFTPDKQDEDVIKLVGPKGELIKGDLLKTYEDTKVNGLEVTKKVEAQLQIKKYPAIKELDNGSNTPENVLAGYLTSWQNNEWGKMVSFCEITWYKKETDPSGFLKRSYNEKKLMGAEIKGVNKVSETESDFTVVIYYSKGKEIYTKIINARVLRESAQDKPDKYGQWGVYPVATIPEI